MKRKTIILAVVAAAAMALSLVGCGVKITNIAVPESAMVEKGESITLPVVNGTDDAPAVTPETAATGESAETDEKLAKAASKLTVEWTSSDESVATVDATGMVVAVSAGEADITASVTNSEMSAVCKVTVKVAAKDITVPDNLDVKLGDTWRDDHCPCVGVTINGVKCSFWWLVDEAAAAFHYLDSPTARTKVMEILQDGLVAWEENQES